MSENPYESFDFGNSNDNSKEEKTQYFSDLFKEADAEAAELAPSTAPAPAQGYPSAPVPEYTQSAPYSEPVEFRELPVTPSYPSATDSPQGYESPSEKSAYSDHFTDMFAQTAAPDKAKAVTSDTVGYYSRSYDTHPSGSDSSPASPGYTRPYSAGSNASASPYRTRTTSAAPDTGRKAKSGGISKGTVAILLIVCMLISAAAGFGGSLIANKVNSSKVETSDNSTLVVYKVDPQAKTVSADEIVDKTTTEITEEVADTVVEITTESMQTSSFYGQYISQGAGSGVIIGEDGYILTNNHVISGATSIKVTTRSGDNYDAKLIGTDSKVDIALIKIEASGLPVAKIGDSSKLEVGSKAVIIGNPLGTLGGSVTEGIISALDRSIVIDGKTMHLMQTDAAINPGNSGGGMFDGQGTLSGIVVAKSSSEEIDNIGFVIPINNVMEILGDLKNYGYVRGRADTGMTFVDLSNSMFAWYYYRSYDAGVYINSVDRGSNAENAGFQKGDRVLSIDGKEVSSSDDITTIIAEKSAGDKVKFEIVRNSSKMSLELTLDEEIPEDIQADSSSSGGYSGNDNPGGMSPYGGFYGSW